ncbi:MAG: restriction endonuclease [Gammaproteobacteria bacterium RIFOXYA12_FULL_61_12]|nr:MAG: restriction endonuclease [Gammaproteobacteria bacterium RIFOXYD12_FULL_61_37]OGT92945.1 MAG: restriction endonuclease [Gammaproteobacteria bacterium RIFOXYA12_FULL_61_12]
MNKHSWVPKLRFPEFREAGAWETIPLSQLAKRSTQKNSLDELNRVLTNSAEFGVIDQRDYFDKDIANQDNLEGYFVVKKGDYVYNPRISTMAPVGPISKNNIETGIMSPLYTVFRFSSSDNDFYAYYFKTTGWHQYMRQASSTGARHDRMAITNGDFMAMPLPVTSPEEQQKIADCLASLDELIALEAQKLDTLKTHKKGLMQQLFPAEGETLPKLRFPEFREAGQWEEKRLGEVGSVRMCKRIFKEQTNSLGDIPFCKIGTFGGVPDAYISREIFESYRNNFPFPKNGAVLISAAGTIGRTVRYEGELAYFQDSNIVWLDNNEKLIADNFLFYLYQLINWAPSVGAIQRLYNENILGAQVKYPSIPEQQKIADCLASLDDLIAAQTQKLAALKAHKKGLMQQLFPVLEEAPA